MRDIRGRRRLCYESRMGKTSNSKLQAPEKFQIPNLKFQSLKRQFHLTLPSQNNTRAARPCRGSPRRRGRSRLQIPKKTRTAVPPHPPLSLEEREWGTEVRGWRGFLAGARR